MTQYTDFDIQQSIQIWTDGGCLGNGSATNTGGCAFVVIQNEALVFSHSYQVDNTTNNKMEISGVIEALKWCKNNGILKPTINCDSIYTINGATTWKHNWLKNNWIKSDKKPVLNKELWIELYDLDNLVQAQFQWVKAHNGSKWNELADELTRQST